MAKSELRQEIENWMGENGINPPVSVKRLGGKAVVLAFTDQRKNYTRVKYRGALSKSQAVELEFHLADIGYDVIDVAPSNRTKPLPMFPLGGGFFDGFVVRIAK